MKIGRINITNKEIKTQISLQFKIVNKKTINTGRENSAVDKPNQPKLNALPLFLLKYLDKVVVAVCVDNPGRPTSLKKLQ